MEILNAAAVQKALPMSACIEAVERAFRSLGDGTAGKPGTLSLHAERGVFHIKAGTLRTDRGHYFTAKVNGNFADNPRDYGLPTIQGVVVACDAHDGRILALMDSGGLTAIRTAAATAVAARYLAREDSSVVAIIGCGVQAPAQVEALRVVMDVRRLVLYDRDTEKAQALAAETGGIVAPTLADAALAGDVIVTCTTSHEYILFPEHVRPGTLVAGVGVDNEHKRELAPELLQSSTLVCDDRAQCARLGDLHHAIEAGMLELDGVHADLSEIVCGKRPARTNAGEIVVFDSTGLGLQDVAAAACVIETSLCP